MRKIRLSASQVARYGILAGLKTAQERADALGISRSHLLHVERGAVRPSEDLVDRMGELYGRETWKIQDACDVQRRSLAKRVLENSRNGGEL